MSDEKSILLNVASKYFNKTDEELVEMIYEKDEEGNLTVKEDAADILIGLDEKRVQRIKEEANGQATKKFDEGYKKAQKEVLTKFEKDLREKFGLESDKNGLDLIDEIVSTASKGGDITEETLKTHPLYLKLEGKQKQAFDEKYESLKSEYEGFKTDIERKRAMQGVKAKAKESFLSLNPVLSEDKAKADKQIDLFLRGLDEYGYVVDGDTFIVTKGDDRLEDAHGNPIKIEDFVADRAKEYFDFKQQTDRQSPGNRSDVGGSAKKKITKEEYGKKIAEYEREGNFEAMSKLRQEYEVI